MLLVGNRQGHFSVFLPTVVLSPSAEAGGLPQLDLYNQTGFCWDHYGQGLPLPALQWWWGCWVTGWTVKWQGELHHGRVHRLVGVAFHPVAEPWVLHNGSEWCSARACWLLGCKEVEAACCAATLSSAGAALAAVRYAESGLATHGEKGALGAGSYRCLPICSETGS